MTRVRTPALAGAALLLLATLAALAPGAAAPAGAAVAPGGVRRMLVVSLPMIGWGDLPLGQMPNLNGLLEQSIVADLSVRGVDPKPTLGDGYLTISAGTRAKGSDRDGATTTRPDGAIVVPAFPDIVRHNDHLLFNAHAGILATTLAKAGIQRAVIANAAGGAPGQFARPNAAAVDAFADPDGVVPGGSVGGALLHGDASSPQGFTIAPDAYLAAFRKAWTGRSVVLVEDSDLVRFETGA